MAIQDYSSFPVPIFPNINDTPIVPTDIQGGNISDLYKRFNDSLAAIETDLSRLDQIASQTSIQLSANTQTIAGSRLDTLLDRVVLLETKVADLEAANNATPATTDIYNFTFTTTEVFGETEIGTIPKDGQILKIVVTSGFIDEFNSWFGLFSTGLIYHDQPLSGDKFYEFVYSNNTVNVTQGDTLYLQTSELDTYNIEVHIYG